MAKKKSEKRIPDLNLVIYLNESFVNGLYANIFGGVAEDILDELTTGGRRKNRISTGAKLKALIPFTAGTEAQVEGDHENEKSHRVRSTQKTTFTNSYRLQKLLDELRDYKKITKIDKNHDFSKINKAEFIEFRASFAKNELLELIELIAPEFASVAAYNFYTNNLQNKTTNKAEFEEKYNQKIVEGWQTLAFQTATTVKSDFNNDISSEFYGTLTGRNDESLDITANIICDNNFFTNGDTERVLDGVYSVIGKVIYLQTGEEGEEKKMTKFDRNKLLRRIRNEGFVALQNWLKTSIPKESYIESDLNLVIEGRAIKVVPIAIYA